KLAALRVYPYALVIGRNWNLRGAVNDDEVVILTGSQQLSDMNMGVALGAVGRGVESQTPFVGPERPGLFDGCGPEHEALPRGHGGEIVIAFPMKSREREPAVRLARAGVPDEKDGRLRGMGCGFAAETALEGLECFRAGDVAGA